MSYALKNRNLSIPNGYKFYQPETKWRASPGSFTALVQQVVAHRRANAARLNSLGIALDVETIEKEVEAYNVRICQVHGWNSYIIGTENAADTGDPPPPKSNPRNLRKSVAASVVGARTVVDWIRSGEEAVSGECAESRAAICAKCPQNNAGDLSSVFTVPIANAIRKALQLREHWNLSTPYDEQLGVCDACGCPLRLKVHCPLELIEKRMDSETREALDAKCWIRRA